jgi:hypothetical protein
VFEFGAKKNEALGIQQRSVVAVILVSSPQDVGPETVLRRFVLFFSLFK